LNGTCQNNSMPRQDNFELSRVRKRAPDQLYA
jgi:hypothetical protein